MPTQVQFRRGTTTQNNNFTGAEGEISVNTSNNTLRVHDGLTAGGFEVALNSDVLTIEQNVASIASNVALISGNVTTINNTLSTAIVSATYGNNISNGTITAARLPATLTAGTAIANAQLSTPVITTASLVNGTKSSGFFQEKANIIASGLSASVNTFSLTDGVIHYLTSSATANTAVNLTGFADRDVANAVTMVVLVTNGASPFYISGVQIDGANANVVRWGGGTAPAGGNASNIDVYSFSVIKTAVSTYTVLAQQSQFGG